MFESAKRKLERAKKHILDLDSTFNAFIKSKPYSLGAKQNPNTGSKMATLRYQGDIPKDVCLCLGDAIHNLRSALDHATWELIGLDRGTQDRVTGFPIRDTRTPYEAAGNGMKTPRCDTIKFFIALAAYEKGLGHLIYVLNRLDIIDKHRFITPVVRYCMTPAVKAVRPDGSVMWEMGGSTFRGDFGGAVGWKNLPPNITVEFDKGCEPTFDISFGKIDFVENESVVPTLLMFEDVVGKTLGQFEKFVRTRP